jgi:hypothetical protein
MPPSPKVPGGVGGALGGLILDHLINPPPVSPAGLDQIDPGLLYPAPPPQAIDPGKAQLWDGGQDPNTYYKIKYQTANISSGTLVGWSGDKYTSPSELKGTISSAQLLINNVPYSSAASDTELFHWSFDGKGLDPFRNERSKNYSLKINNAEVYPISVTFGVKILGFVPTNGGIDPGGDPPPILPPITSDAGNNLAPTPLPGLSPLPTPPIVAPSPLPGTTGSNTDSNRKAGYPPSATPTTQPNTTAPSTPTNPPDALGTDTNTTPNNLAPDLPLVPPGIIAPPPTSRVPSNTPSNTPSPVTRPYVPNTGTNVNNGAQPGTDIAPRDTPDAVQTPVDRCVTDCPMPPVNLNPTDSANLNSMLGLLQAIMALLQAVNTWLISTLLPIVNTINATTTTINNFVQTAWRATRMDKVINALNLLVALHNAALLSRNLGETLGELTSQSLSSFGIEDEEGNPLDINETIGSLTESFFTSLLGQEVYTGIKDTWHKASRILSSASNIIWTIRSITDSMREIAEWTAENTGKIGNALKRFRVVGENAYKWMPEQVTATNAWMLRINRFREGVDSIDDTASSLSSVLSEVQGIQEEFDQLDEQKNKFNENLQALTPKEREDNTPVKEARADSLEASKAPTGIEDVFRGEGEELQ